MFVLVIALFATDPGRAGRGPPQHHQERIDCPDRQFPRHHHGIRQRGLADPVRHGPVPQVWPGTLPV
eukprot:scaffold235183_cov44-Prasinocladus_malaysianus.AAC.2